MLAEAEAGSWGAKRLLSRVNPARTLPLMTDASGEGVIAIAIPGIAACVFKLQEAAHLTGLRQLRLRPERATPVATTP